MGPEEIKVGSIYTFYPYTADGVTLSLEALELSDDGAAMLHARRLLVQHASAAEVEVWEENRPVHRAVRAEPGSGDGPGRPKGPSAGLERGSPRDSLTASND